MNFPIDFVVTWVDDSDVNWRKKKNEYLHELNNKGMSSVKAYRDWGTFKYWFRGIEKYVPWVNKIYLVTDSQKPSWLDENNEKLVIVDHRDIISHEYLPVFNSNAIECNIHKIKGLSEHFVVFNDDMYIMNHIKPTDFFSESGLPKGRTSINPIVPYKNGTANFQVNNMEIVTDYFSKKEIITNAKLYSLKQGLKNLIRTFLYENSKFFFGFFEDHMPYPILKSTYMKLWDNERTILEQTSSSRFRSMSDTNIWLFKYWQFASGNYEVGSEIGKLFELSNDNSYIWKVMKEKKYKVMCINDGFDIKDEKKVMNEFIVNMEKKFPQSSFFEKN